MAERMGFEPMCAFTQTDFEQMGFRLCSSEWTRRMNSIRNRIEEFVLHDLVYA
ncbi:MAG: hypothetical protein IJU20_08645 [Clostridia bacterium]|nr:hypothetical protein [Clostridia bacterium]